MRYNVRWLKSAEQSLAECWLTASNRAEVTAAADQIDESLAVDPLSFGESRMGITRLAIVPPLTVLFDVDTGAHSVTVWDLWRWP